MPSDKLINSVAQHLEAAGEPYRNAVALTVQQVQRILADHQDSRDEVLANNNAELGAFAADRIDIEKFSALVSRSESLDKEMLGVVERSLTVLEVVEKMSEDVFTVKVPRGTPAGQAVRDALRQIGLAFGAGRAIRLAKNGGHNEGEHHSLLDGIPFSEWTKSERLMTPPLLLEIEGADLAAASLAEFMDGNVKLVIQPTGPCAPAPLVRLITPRTFVLQTRNPATLAAFAKWDGPGIALVSENAARFVHDPTGGTSLKDRLRVEILPANPKSSIGGISVRQQLEELEQLRTLSNVADIPTSVASNGDETKAELPPDPADKLAAWLMNQARDISAV